MDDEFDSLESDFHSARSDEQDAFLEFIAEITDDEDEDDLLM